MLQILWDSSIVHLLIIIFLPTVLHHVLSLVRTSSSYPLPTHLPKRLTDHLTSALLLFACCCYIYQAQYLYPPNLFTELEVDYDAPNFMLRNRVRDYSAYQISMDANFASTPAYDRLQKLFERFKVTENRKNYALFGEEAFLSCGAFCTETKDYQLYLLPTIALSYLLAAVVIGLTTLTPRKSFWRNYSPMLLLLLATVEMSFYIASDISGAADPLGLDIPFLHDTMTAIRNYAFSLLFAVMLWMDKPLKVTEEFLAELALKRQEECGQKMTASRLMRSAVMRDDGLRMKWEQYWREREMVRREVVGDKAYQGVRERVSKAVDVDKLERDTEKMVERWFDGIVGASNSEHEKAE